MIPVLLEVVVAPVVVLAVVPVALVPVVVPLRAAAPAQMHPRREREHVNPTISPILNARKVTK